MDRRQKKGLVTGPIEGSRFVTKGEGEDPHWQGDSLVGSRAGEPRRKCRGVGGLWILRRSQDVAGRIAPRVGGGKESNSEEERKVHLKCIV